MVEAEMIKALNQEIARLSGSMRENEEKVRRLRKTKSNVETEQEELINNKKIVYLPEFSSTSWAGKHAAEHSNIRDSIDQIVTNIANQQVENSLDDLEKKINELEQENNALRNSISANQSAIIKINNK
ncbi:DUF5082 family protein [Bacillus aquiflavi]|uniref:DUF5082 domain-containing protein n=1 Tax=Bacillus aquiflavi TaxID=2672567 RepID=A0A6B3VUI8_9BACI|nr:DUF5082 family protein [Bacillus aquiflavi]MBA4535601.1 DUF5082 family protein [Bacillus aquiflavi]NEY79977.1 DUF5082 domain-containing protein [Bacillus aquiflavi]UAC48919.1 DUF5082 domain-containing protein [Bacillus aquiflavi]